MKKYIAPLITVIQIKTELMLASRFDRGQDRQSIKVTDDLYNDEFNSKGYDSFWDDDL